MKKTKEKKSAFKKFLIVFCSIILVIAVAAAVIVFGVYRGTYMYILLQQGQEVPPASEYMMIDADAEYVKTPDVDTSKEGQHILQIKSEYGTRYVMLIVRDTMAPTAEAANPSITIDDTKLAPEDAIKNAEDVNKFTVKWKTEPKYGVAGTYECAVELADDHGNVSVIETTVKVLGAVDVLIHEAGDPRPTLEDFMVVEREEAELKTDLSSIKWNVPDDYTVEVAFDGDTYESTLRIVDTVEPAPVLVDGAVLAGGEIEAKELVASCDDATEVSYEFAEAPVLDKVGTVKCQVVATDLGGNTATVDGRIIVCDAIASFEAADDTVGEGRILSNIDAKYSRYTMEGEPVAISALGAKAVTFTHGEDSIIVGVVVKDTTAPTADGIDCPCSTGYYCEPIKFVENIVDISPVTASFAAEPDWNTEGEQDVEIILTDASGNTATVKAKAVITPDTVSPVIYAARDQYCYVGDEVAYFKEICAGDNADPNPEITVDKSKVDPKTAGEYEVTYTAKDESGNESTATVKYIFKEKTVTEEKLKEAVKAVTDKIFKDGMTTAQQLKAVFDYCNKNITSRGDSDKTDLYGEAYRGLTEGVGDGYTFYAASYVLLQEIDDIQVLTVERMNGKTEHFWCLVNAGSGWYHFDTCNASPEHYKCFMKVNADLEPLSSQYWAFNSDMYPEVAAMPFAMK